MAKAQGISLSPSEITGMCGRLRCCLVYEYEQYVEARKQLPRRNKRIGTPNGEGRVIDQLPLLDAVRVDYGEGVRKTVLRADIIPLEEFRKLAEKAHAPCDRHGDGSCECGLPAGQRVADQVNARVDDDAPPSAPAGEVVEPKEAAKSDQERSRRARGKPREGEPRASRRRRRRRGGRRSKKSGSPPSNKDRNTE